MAVAWRSIGTAADTATQGNTVAPGDPAGLTTGDIQVLLEIHSGFGTNPTLATFPNLPAGFTIIGSEQHAIADGTNRRVRFRASWALDTATDPTPATNSNSANLSTNYIFRAIRFAISGVDTTNPVEAVSFYADTSESSFVESATNTIVVPGVNTSVLDTTVVAVVAASDDQTFTNGAFAVNPTLTERFDTATTTGGDQGLGVWSGQHTGSGPTGDFSTTISSVVTLVGMVVAFKEANAAVPTSAGTMLRGIG